jgi:hypothetical protein
MQLGFIGVGPQRAGTTWLHEQLIQHPSVCLPMPPVKETFFFDRSFERGIGYYESFFAADQREHKLVGEFGPSYFDCADAPARISRLNPRCKIIVNVRNPVDRAYSLFIHMASYGEVPTDFASAIERAPGILSTGRYRVHLERWMGTFSREQLHFVVLDDIEREPQRVFDTLCAFLGLPAEAAPRVASGRVNVARLPRSPRLRRFRSMLWQALARNQRHETLRMASKLWRMGPGRLERVRPAEKWPRLTTAQRQQLSNLYEEDIRFLESILGRSFEGWRTESG